MLEQYHCHSKTKERDHCEYYDQIRRGMWIMMCLFMQQCSMVCASNTRTWKIHVWNANKKKGTNVRLKIVSVFPLTNPRAGWFWRLFSAKYHTFTREFLLIQTEQGSKKVDVFDLKNLTDVEYHKTCNIYRIYDLNIRDCRY